MPCLGWVGGCGSMPLVIITSEIATKKSNGLQLYRFLLNECEITDELKYLTILLKYLGRR